MPERPTVPGMPLLATADAYDLQSIQLGVLRMCDVVFGVIMTALALFSTALWLDDQNELSVMLALWFVVVFNLGWSRMTRGLERVKADMPRGLVCMPVTMFMYIHGRGPLEDMWVPALVMAVGTGLCVGLAGRGTLGCIVSLIYAGSLALTDSLVNNEGWSGALSDAVGIALTGCVISLVCQSLSGMVQQARRHRDLISEQRDRAEGALSQLTERSSELSTAIETLHREMEVRMRVEVELRHAQKLESVGRLAAGVAHEINTPVQFVSDSLQFVREGMVDLLRSGGKIDADVDVPYLMENLPQALDRALEGLERVTAIVRAMKEFAHPDSSMMVATNVNRAIVSTLTVARNEYKYVAEVETDLGDIPDVPCHAGELNQAVLNIVVNAAHAIGDVVHGTSDKGRIRVQTRRDGADVVIAISDTGGGIPESARERIFDPFFTTKPVGRGTGQGLAIARSVIVDKHGGKLDFQTELGVGTTFSIRLPIEPRHTAVRAEAA